MNSDALLDCALFQLSPRRTRCELFVSGDGKTEKLASGFVKPFASHMEVVEERVSSQASRLIKLEVGAGNVPQWFNKGTLERFVRFVSTPEVLELVGTFDAEMSQLEGARRMYSEGGGDQAPPSSSSENVTVSTEATDITKKELLRAIDVRLVAVKHDLTMACARASAAGFTFDNVSELLCFADRFGAHRLNEACTKFLSLCQRHPELICHQRPESISHQHAPSSLLPTHLKGFSDRNIRSSASSDMSIDEPEVEPSCSIKQITSGTCQPIDKINTSQPSAHAAAELATTCQQPKPDVQRPMENHVDKTTEEPAPSSAPAETAQPGGSGSRRLSVQDRINLFESKKKEQSTSATVINSSVGGGANKVAGKPELRRLSSDASEKSVLRRWSGASDMSIDLTNSGTSCNDRKDIRSPVTLSSSANSHVQTNCKTEDEADRLKDTATSLSQLGSNVISASTHSSSSISLSEAKAGAFPKDRNRADKIIRREDTAASKIQRLPDKEKDDWGSEIQCGASLAKLQQVGLADQAASVTKSTLIPEASKLSGLKYQEGSGIQCKDVFDGHAEVKDHTILQLSPRVVTDGVKQIEQQDQVSLCSQTRNVTETNLHVKDQPALMTKHKTFSIKPENAGAKTEAPLDTDFQFNVALGTTEGFVPKNDLPAPSLPKWRTLPGKEKEVRRNALPVTPEAISIETEDSPLQRMKLHNKAYIPDLTNKLPRTSDWKFLKEENSAIVSLGNKTKGDVEMFGPRSTSSIEHVQEVRPSKGNQERNDVLQMKADELEKLFAAHKLRIHGDQTSSRRSKPIDVKVDDVPWVVERSLTEDITDHLQETKPLNGSSSYGSEFDARTLLKLVDNKEHSSNMKQGLGDFSSSNEVRGKFYANYMQKRDAKLKKEHGSKRPQKEAKMTEMYDSLERIQAEMKTKFTRSTSQHNLDSARHRAEKIKSFSARSASKTKGQSVENFQGEEHEDLQDHYKDFPCAQDECFSDTLLGGEQTISNRSNKLSFGKLVSSSTPRTSVRSVPKSAKGSNYGSNNRRTQPENPLAQSVPNFSYFTKENMKPSTGSIKETPRTKSKNIARSKSSIDEMNPAKEENPGRPRSMRESSANPLELQDLSPVNSYSANKATGLKNSEQTESAVPNKIRSCDLRQFLTKGDSIGPGSRADIAKMKAAIASGILKSDEQSVGLVDQQNNLPDMARDEEKDSVRPSTAGDRRSLDFSVESDSEKPRLSLESGNSGDPGLENRDALISMSQGDDALVRISSKFDIFSGNMPESPGESPGSWNSHVHQSFSNTQEASDIDGSVESPIGSSPSWNSHHLNQMMETDAARMRKKWGSAQVPVLVANASHQSHNDVTKGFKRLLKFGRKNKGTEVLVNDWKSASTASEGDEDTEDFHDLANQSSDDLRKPRMGFPVVAYDGFSESGGVYPEQVESLYNSIPIPPGNFKLKEEHLSGSSLKVPRSFFSLSSFRSKGSEPKLR